MAKLLHRLPANSENHYRRNRHKTAMRHAIRSARIRAEEKGIPFDIDLEYMLSLGETCALSGLGFRDPEGHVGAYSPSIDRVVPSLGYTKGNTRLILHCLNSMKGVETDKEMFGIMVAVLERNILCLNEN